MGTKAKNGTMAAAEAIITEIAEKHGWEGGDVRLHARWSAIKDAAILKLTSAIDAGDIGTGKHPDKASSRYAKDLVAEVRRMPELNGGSRYVPTGTRGPRDPELKELKVLRDNTADAELKAQITALITDKEAEIKAASNRAFDPTKVSAELLAKLREMGAIQ